MSERFQKIYISANEFISSWEKEIYEMTNLDYFTFLLINHLGNIIENEYFNQENTNAYLRIDPEEIATLSFNIGDSFESFLENNCFGDCTLGCPTALDEMVDANDKELSNSHLGIIQMINGSRLSKKQYLMTDILNYVVLDTLYDFYNYEIGLDLDDADTGIVQLADFITLAIQSFMENRGEPFLHQPRESAGDLFETILSEFSDTWDEASDSLFEDDEDIEEWKYGNLNAVRVIQEYQAELPPDAMAARKLLEYFQEFMDEYAGIGQIDDLEKEDIEEFFLFWLLRKASLEQDIPAEQIRTVFEQFFTWLEFRHNAEVLEIFNEFMDVNGKYLITTLNLTRAYFENNSLISGVLDANVAEDQLAEGYFKVEKVADTGLLRLKDVHFRQTYLNVKINLAEPEQLIGTILEASIKFTAYGWRVINLEYIFPGQAVSYLH
ncbi:MAG: hypothetical protein E4H13_03990 [Calditrichales bacterium]|nr:MAG: hypothetical protein E4H13_03990 [Calditrichales bacterium]